MPDVHTWQSNERLVLERLYCSIRTRHVTADQEAVLRALADRNSVRLPHPDGPVQLVGPHLLGLAMLAVRQDEPAISVMRRCGRWWEG